MTTGTVTSYDAEKGSGAVRPDGTKHDLPFSTKDLARPELQAQLREGDRVRFQIEGGLTGLGITNLRPAS